MLYKRERTRRRVFIWPPIMTSSDGFYLTLPSDGSMATFPNNTVAQFKTLLPQRIDLTDGEWEVGLSEMMYGTSVKNIFQEEAFFDLLITQEFSSQIRDPNFFQINRFYMEKIYSTPLSKCFTIVDWSDSYLEKEALTEGLDLLGELKTVTMDPQMDVIRVYFRPGPYIHPKALTTEINEGLQRCMKKIWKTLGHPEQTTNMQLVYYDKFERIEYQYNGKLLRTKNPFCVRFPLSLAYKLGFGGKAIPPLNSENMTAWLNVDYLAPNTIDLYENLKQMYIYCDVIEPQMVGSNALKLLRVVPMIAAAAAADDGREGKWEPKRIQYVKLSKKYFESLEIQIRTPLGSPMPFISGKSILILHFRKIY